MELLYQLSYNGDKTILNVFSKKSNFIDEKIIKQNLI